MVKAYDVLGREVKKLVNRLEGAGAHSVSFDGNKLPEIYFCRMYALADDEHRFSSIDKMILLK